MTITHLSGDAEITSIIADAVGNGTAVTMPPGVWELSLAMVDITNFVMCAEVPGTVTLKPDDLELSIVDIQNGDGVTIDGIEVDGLYPELGPQDTLSFWGVDRLQIRDCTVRNGWHRGISLKAAGVQHYDVRVTGCRFYNMERDAVCLNNAQGVWVHDCITDGSNDVAIDLYGCRDVFVVGNSVGNCHQGIGIYSPQGHVVVRGNSVYAAGSNAIRVSSDDENPIACAINVEGNMISNVTGNAISLNQPGVTVQGNVMYLTNTSGIQITADDTTALKNTVCGAALYAVICDDSEGHYIAHNVFREPLGGVLLRNARHAVVQGNSFLNSRDSNDIVEFGTADYNMVIDNLVRDRKAIHTTGAHTVVDGTRWH